MGIYLNPGNRMFQTMLNSFMNERLGSQTRSVGVSRPRRFGKSMDANMLCA